ncbi:hypothetical protein [Rubripirellula reticaptiva]|uniref:Uncharacterized protein n=1 Tax=Rubripirellula reticaptiva TaxID=2528013 RepID=A0A5C6EUD8_9BACT|nr:hypothetical protein [Rubripirellula reticaptiva]TWU51226.1 hypothetical protein Poly59_28180 [Rubripirellula reticaptiva]
MAVLAELTGRAELVKAKVLSPEQDQIAEDAGTPIGEHIEAFVEYQRQKRTGKKRIDAYDSKLRESPAVCGFSRLSTISIESWLNRDLS